MKRDGLPTSGMSAVFVWSVEYALKMEAKTERAQQEMKGSLPGEVGKTGPR